MAFYFWKFWVNELFELFWFGLRPVDCCFNLPLTGTGGSTLGWWWPWEAAGTLWIFCTLRMMKDREFCLGEALVSFVVSLPPMERHCLSPEPVPDLCVSSCLGMLSGWLMRCLELRSGCFSMLMSRLMASFSVDSLLAWSNRESSSSIFISINCDS